MKTISLTQGKVALVDDADFDAVSQFKWHAEKSRQNFYAVRKIRKPDGKWANLRLHQFLLPGVPEVDHIDGNGLNNQRYNLRPATRQQNAQGSRRKAFRATSRFRGVYWNSGRKRWQASLTDKDKNFYLGMFTNEEDAGRAYNEAAIKYFGDRAHLNII